ncbi:MAG: Ig-like domain-containing protein [Myxococcota bacterium]
MMDMRKLARARSLVLLSAAITLSGATCNDKPGGGGDGSEPGEGEVTSGPRTHPDLGEGGDGGGASTKIAGGPAGEVALGPDGKPLPSGLVFTISEGVPEGGRKEPAPPAKATKLTDAEANAILARLPSIEVQSDDQKDFALRPGSKPPPLTGATIAETWPPPVKPDVATPDVNNGPPKVLRYQPEGDVPLAPRITITFSNPMVPVTSHDTLAKEAVPVSLTPTIEGNWRWVGAKTLFFDPVGRAPMATEFKAEVKAGVKDATGTPLAEGKAWSFRTPPPSILSSSPSGDSVELEPVLYVLFDQKVDPAAVRAKLTVTAGDKKMKTRELTKEEYDKLPQGWREDKDNVGRWFAFKLTEKLDTDTNVTVTFPAGTPSAEGPRVTEKEQSFSFKTYGPFKILEARCGWGDECRPGMPFQITFSNPIDEDKMEEKMIAVEPAITALSADVYGQTLNLQGLTKGKTSYTVTIKGDLKDIYGQTLGKDEEKRFRVGPSEKMLMSTVGPMIVLDPMAKKRRLPVYVMNMGELDVELYKVNPAKDWAKYNTFIQERWRDDGPKTPPGERVFAKKIDTGMTAEELSEVDIDLSPALTGDFGQLIAVVKPVGMDSKDDKWARDRSTVITWVQVTQIGLDAFVDQQELVGWATALVDGKVLSGLELELSPTGKKATTDATGLATIPLPEKAGREMLLARSGDDLAFVPDSDYSYGDDGQWVKQSEEAQTRWMVFDDRHLYRPTETVNIKGILRLHEPGEKGDVAALPAGALTKVSYQVIESQGNEITKGTVDVSANGTFKLQFKLPDTPNLGSARVHFSTGLGAYANSEYDHYFDIQEFRRPEFEVSATASEGPHFVGGKGSASITASYFAGGPLPNAEVTWNVTSTRGYFVPPNQSDFVFGTWEPWWGWRDEWHRGPGGGDNSYQSFTGRTDASGTHMISLDFKSLTPPRPASVTAEATVQDVNRQVWSTSTSLLVHPARYYVGMKTPRYFVEQGQSIDVETIVADIDGKRIEGTPIEMTMVRLDYKKVKKKGWTEVEADPETCKVVSGKDPQKCTFHPKQGGQHKITAKIADPEKRPNQSEITVWVPGGKTPADRDLKQEDVQIIPSKQKYEPGETAELMLQAPFFPASGVYSIRRGNMVENMPVNFDGPSQTIKIKIEEWMIPGVTVVVTLAGSAVRPNDDGTPNENLPRRPAFASGSLSLDVPATLRRLTVEAVPAAARIEPGADTSVTVTVKDSSGKTVSGAEVALIVVDESVLALAGYTMADPIGIFYQGRGDYTRTERSRSRLVLAALKELFAQAGGDKDMDGVADDARKKMAEREEGAGGMVRATAAMPSPAPPMMEAAKPEEAPGGPGANVGGPIAVRKNFDALAVFAPDVPTDADGKATVQVKLPDNLTRYRVMAVALSGPKHFGSGESSITARLPLMVRMSPPRFLNFGDSFELPVVLQNQTDEAIDVKLAVRSTNATVDQGAGRAVKIAANDRVEVRIPMSALKAGTARFQAGAVSGKWADAAEVKLPVWTPATTEAFATYGEVDKGGTVQPVQVPGEVWPQFGALEVQTSSTQLQALTDAVLYLTTYPYECSEQLSSRILAIAALKDVLSAFKTPELPKPEVLIASVAADIKHLQGMQADDGGFAFWRRDQETWPFLTIHVTHALLRAKEKGFEVPQWMLDRALDYLRNIRSHMTEPWYTEDVKRAIEAYALYVRTRANEGDPARARALISEAGGLDKADLEMVAWLYPVMTGKAGFERDIEAIRKHLNNRVSETAGMAHFVTSYGDGAYLLLHSDRRVDGLLLEDLIGDQPSSDLIPKIVRGLLAHKTAGRWENTQESAWVLLGLDKYFNTFEKIEPNFVVRAWLGDNYAGDHTFKGRTTERSQITVPMAKLAEMGQKQDLTLVKEGVGRLYYRIGMSYAPKSLKLEPSEHGFHVERSYEGADDPKDVTHNPDGTWTVRAGSRVKVKLMMHTEDRRYHVALVDPMPAGFEALNPELRGTQATPPRDEGGGGGGEDWGGRGGGRWWWWGPWYEHENLRDDRAEAFTSLLWEGVYTYTYYARATTPGNFVVPPTKAEEMYAPETFGRGASDRVVVQ